VADERERKEAIHVDRTVTIGEYEESGPPTRVRWGAVIAGGVLAVALLLLLSSFWMALGFGSGIDAVAQNLEWFIGGSAIACLFVGGWSPDACPGFAEPARGSRTAPRSGPSCCS
jgi:hypothetical protein